MKHLLKSFDHWVGTRMFVPPIIAFCQATRQNQHEAAGCFAITAFLLSAYEISQTEPSTTGYIFFTLFIIFAVGIYYVTFIRHEETRSSSSFRAVAWFFLTMAVIRTTLLVIFGLNFDLYTEAFWILILASDYASGIGTIPPRKKRDSAKNAREAHARS